MYLEKSLKKYLDDLAGRLAAPGGGSASALTGANAFALVSMVCNFTVGNEKYRDNWDAVNKILKDSERLRGEMMRLIDEDCNAYLKVEKAFRMSKENAALKQKRSAAIELSIKGALGVPLEICKLSRQGMNLCKDLIDISNPNLISDIGVAASLFNGAFESALFNVQVNLNAIIDEGYIENIKCIIEPIYFEVGHLKEYLFQKTQKKFKVTI